MSWFQDIAGKAENLLNQIDQNAASVLHQKTINVNANEETVIINMKDDIHVDHHPVALAAVQIPRSDTNNEEISMQKSTATISSSSSSATTTNDDMMHEILALKILLNEVKSERNKYLEELKLFKEQEIVKENTHKTIIELEIFNQHLQAENDSLKLSNETNRKSIEDLKSCLAKQCQIEQELQAKLDCGKKETDQSLLELQQYRQRAQKTLQMKDELINKLILTNETKTATNKLSSSESIEESFLVTSSPSMPPSQQSPIRQQQEFELDNLKKEKLKLLDEIYLQNNQLEQIRAYVDRLETTQQEQQNEFELKLNTVTNNLRIEESKWLISERENQNQMRELDMVRNEMDRLKKSVNFASDKHKVELSKLQLQSNQSNRNYTGSMGLEERVHSLTQSLVQKQNSLESVTADRNALKLQLEKLEQEHHSAISIMHKTRPAVISVNDTDDAKAHVPIFLQENPFDTSVSRRVKRAFSTLDSMGVWLTIGLRRYPFIRILSIFYITLLHFWVMIVLFTSTPSTT